MSNLSVDGETGVRPVKFVAVDDMRHMHGRSGEWGWVYKKGGLSLAEIIALGLLSSINYSICSSQFDIWY